MSRLFTFLTILALCCSCNTSNGDRTNISNSLITDNDTTIVDRNIIDSLYFEKRVVNANLQPLSKSELVSLGTERFFPSITDYSNWYLCDTLYFSDNYKTFLLAQNKNKNDRQIFLATYNHQSELIDSRIIFRYNYNKNYSYITDYTSTALNLDSSYFSTKPIQEYVDQWRIEIQENGKFEFEPEIPYSTDTIASGNCRGYGIDLKFAIGEEWTALFLSANSVTNQKRFGKVEVYKTKQHMIDVFMNIETLFSPIVDCPKEDDYVFIDIAFKGAYTNDDFEVLTLDEEPIDDYSALIDHALPATTVPYRSIHSVKGFVYNYQKYTLMNLKVSNNPDYEYYSLVYISPNNEWLELIPQSNSENEAVFFRFRDEVFLYTLEYGIANVYTKIYKITNDGLKLIYGHSVTCD